MATNYHRLVIVYMMCYAGCTRGRTQFLLNILFDTEMVKRCTYPLEKCVEYSYEKMTINSAVLQSLSFANLSLNISIIIVNKYHNYCTEWIANSFGKDICGRKRIYQNDLTS